MSKLPHLFGNIKMTTSILGLVMIAIVGSIGAVSGAMYFNLHKEALATSSQQQSSNLGAAATILERRLFGSVLNWSAEGTMASFQTWNVSSFEDTTVIDSVTRVTKQDASIFALDEGTGAFVTKTTSLVGTDGERAVGTVIASDGPAHQTLMRGAPFVGEVTVDDTDYFGALQPINDMSGKLIGAMFVGTLMANVEASANSVLGTILTVGAGVAIMFSLIGLALSKLITQPIPRLATSMERSHQASTRPRCLTPSSATRSARWRVLWQYFERMGFGLAR